MFISRLFVIKYRGTEQYFSSSVSFVYHLVFVDTLMVKVVNYSTLSPSLL